MNTAPMNGPMNEPMNEPVGATMKKPRASSGSANRLLAAALATASGLLSAPAVGALQDHFLYFPASESVPAMLSPGFHAWPSQDRGEFRGLLAEPGVPARDVRATAIVFHGNAGHAGHRKPYGAALAAQGFRVILAEYPGYGPRSGPLGEASFVADAVEIIDSAWAQFGPPLVIIGESLGAGVAAAASGQRPRKAAGVMLITPWDKLTQVASYHYPLLPVSWLLRDRYDSGANLATFDGPVLIVTAQRDSIVPARFGQALHDSLKRETNAMPRPRRALQEIQDAGHNDWLGKVDATWWRDAVDFLLAPRD